MRRFFAGLGGVVVVGLVILLALVFGWRNQGVALLGTVGLTLASPFEAIFETPQRLATFEASRAQWASDLTALASVEQLKAENAALRAQLKLAPKPALTLAPGRFVYADRNLAGQSFLVQLEAPLMVKAGEAVIAPGNILIGKVERSQDRFVWAKFVADATLAVSVISGPSRARGVIKGSGETGLVMRLTAGAPLPQVGEPVFTDTLDPDVPAALLVGTVKALPKDTTTPERLVSVAPAFQDFTVAPVFIVTAW